MSNEKERDKKVDFKRDKADFQNRTVVREGGGFRLNKGSQNSKIEFLDSIMDPKILR